ncbi:MAG: hypothetical protein HQL97_03850 [Magnetococcales bacterium]|nr:hypothetical protein [Magnetococcales bacterium]
MRTEAATNIPQRVSRKGVGHDGLNGHPQAELILDSVLLFKGGMLVWKDAH